MTPFRTESEKRNETRQYLAAADILKCGQQTARWLEGLILTRGHVVLAGGAYRPHSA